MFVELTQVIHGTVLKNSKTIVNISKIKKVSKDGDSGNTLIEFGLDEYITVKESYEKLSLILLLGSDSQ